MSNNKFHKILSDTITLPLLLASQKITDTSYYAVLERNYIPITSDINCIYKPDWITGYKFIKEGENENETKEDLKYYNKLTVTQIAFKLGVGKSTVSRHISKAKNRLHKLLTYYLISK